MFLIFCGLCVSFVLAFRYSKSSPIFFDFITLTKVDYIWLRFGEVLPRKPVAMVIAKQGRSGAVVVVMRLHLI